MATIRGRKQRFPYLTLSDCLHTICLRSHSRIFNSTRLGPNMAIGPGARYHDSRALAPSHAMGTPRKPHSGQPTIRSTRRRGEIPRLRHPRFDFQPQPHHIAPDALPFAAAGRFPLRRQSR